MLFLTAINPTVVQSVAEGIPGAFADNPMDVGKCFLKEAVTYILICKNLILQKTERSFNIGRNQLTSMSMYSKNEIKYESAFRVKWIPTVRSDFTCVF